MAYTLRTTDAAGQMGRAADQNESVNNDIFFNAQHLAPVNAWNPDKPPVSPGAIDDEFADAAIAGAWTEYDPDAKTTWAEGDGGLKASTLTLATMTVHGIYQTLPDGDFTIWTKVAFLSYVSAGNDWEVGIHLWENPAGDNKQLTWTARMDTTAAFPMQCQCVEWTNRSTAGLVKLGATTVGYTNQLYLRLRRNVANYYIDFSMDGLGWRTANAGAAITLVGPWVPTKVGLGVLNYNTAATQVAVIPFFRYIASDVGLSGIMAGARG